MITISTLSQHQRNALPAQHFALPKERRFPIEDRSHTILAWDMVDRAKGLSETQRSTARRNILRRAHELGIDTSKWRNIALHAALSPDNVDQRSDVSAAARTSSFMADDDGHPNKMPFSGILTWFDVPSDNAPHGSQGMNVLIPSDVGIPALDTLIGMGVNFVVDGDWASHSPTDKVAVVTNAYAGEPDEDGAIPAFIEGFIYAKDFPDVASAIKTNQHILGFSYETAQTGVVDDEFNGAPVAKVVDLGYFTGASILLKNAAAYTNTSIAASADSSVNEKGDERVASEMKPEHAQAIQALKAAIKHIDAITDSIMAEYNIPDADKDVQASATPNDDNVNGEGNDEGVQAAANDLSPNGDDPVSGKEIPVLNANATNATQTDVQASADVPTIEALMARLAALEGELETVKTQKAELQAARDAATAQRTSIAYPNVPVSKTDVQPKDEFTELMASVDADESLSVEERWAKKMELRDQRLKALKAAQ